MDPGADQNHITALLVRWQDGETRALDELVPIVYQELRGLARAQLARQVQPTIQPTELVAEAYVKLVGANGASWQSRAHFFSVAARAMRHVLIDRYRRRQADRRQAEGGLLTLIDDLASDNDETRQVDLIALDEALTELEHLDSRQSEIVTLKFFGGLSVDEIAEVLGVSGRTVKREWMAARLWLFSQLKRHGER